MNAFRCLKMVARPTSNAAPLLGPPIAHVAPSQLVPSYSRSLSILAARRPMLSSSPNFTVARTPSHTLPSSDALDLLPKVSSHPALAGTQVRCGPRDTFNPSHLVRKRRHGFLTRLKSKKGRKLLMRRIKKGRHILSH